MYRKFSFARIVVSFLSIAVFFTSVFSVAYAAGGGSVSSPKDRDQIITQIPTGLVKDVTGTTKTLSQKFVGWMISMFWICAVGFVIWAAFLYLTAGGSEDNITKAKKYIIYALIAAAIALLSTFIDVIVSNLLGGKIESQD